jgi:hypothetical protein
MFSVRSRRSGARLGEVVPTTVGVAAVIVARAGGVGEAGEPTLAVGLWGGSAVGTDVCTGEETGWVGVFVAVIADAGTGVGEVGADVRIGVAAARVSSGGASTTGARLLLQPANPKANNRAIAIQPRTRLPDPISDTSPWCFRPSGYGPIRKLLSQSS